MSGRSSIIEFESLYPPRDIGESLNGSIGFYKGTPGNESSWMEHRFGSKPAICIKYHSSFQWMPIETLSNANLKKYRENIANNYGLLYKKFIRGKEKIKKLKRENDDGENDDEALMAHLWGSYNPRTQSELMQEILNQFPNSTFSKKTCSVCLKFAGNDKKKCMHIDCPGMCIECHSSNFGNAFESIECESCPSCKKEQKSTCPICLYDKKQDELIYGDNCSHSICCKCFCSSFSSTPIVDCPLCRKNFKKTHWRTRTGPNIQ
jgi:hypothetical protein